ncbi:leucine-rich_repeat domain-containing protein [Hexamita inflata]|uniref:Leucine-rich repeat domain-containing protein n=1 Tax=Hexamita inflata TaxID=28002 RepID=A0AA86UMX4_9EUKA|nr:leucine-rich repeat domain-containing protein [Hexamita inflata]
MNSKYKTVPTSFLNLTTVLENLYEEETVTIQNFGQFKKLEELTLQYYEYLNLKLIPELQLTKLELAACNLTNIELLTQFQQLSSLSLQFNPEIDIRPLSKMIWLTKLILSKCCLKNVDSLKSLVQLQELDLAYNYNIDIHPLQFLKQLTKLILTNCSLNDLTYLKPLVNLKNINIALNNIIYLEPLEKHNQIEKLNVIQNRILDLQVLNSHPNFASYEVSYQSEANQIEIRLANQLRDINFQITSLRNIDKIKSNMRNKITTECCKVTKCLQQIYDIYNQFSGYVASLMQQLNQHQDLQ